MCDSTRQELEEFARAILKDIPKHYQTSPDTQKQLDEIKESVSHLNCRANNSRLNKLEVAIYGDKQDDTSPGMKMQLDEMHKFFIGTKGASRLIVWMFGGLATIGAGLMALKVFLKQMLNG